MNPNSLKNFGWDDPEIVAKRIAGIKSISSLKLERRAKMKVSLKAMWDPERRKAYAEKSRLRWADSEYRANFKGGRKPKAALSPKPVPKKRKPRRIDDDAEFRAKLKREGFTVDEIRNLMTVGRVKL
jgi:hypothetical protein